MKKVAAPTIDNIRNYKSDDEELYNGRVYYDMDGIMMRKMNASDSRHAENAAKSAP